MAKVKGLEKTIRALRKEGSQRGEIREALRNSLYEMGFKIMRDAKKQTPVDTGRLRASGYVQPPEESRKGPTLKLGFGTDYAIYVHENTKSHHNIGKAKFLTDPINKMRARWEQVMGALMRKHVRNRGGSVPREQPTSPDSGGHG